MHTLHAYSVWIAWNLSLKYGVLGLLAEEPLHGYEVKNRFESMLGGTWEVNIGQIYTTLQRLERDGLVRPVGARGDRGKLLYEPSPAGRKALVSWLAQPDSGPQQRTGACRHCLGGRSAPTCSDCVTSTSSRSERDVTDAMTWRGSFAAPYFTRRQI